VDAQEVSLLIPLLVALSAQTDVSPPVITHVKIVNAPINEPITVRARIEDESEVFAPSVYVRAVGSEQFDNIPMKKGEEGYEAIIPAEQVTQAIEYFIEAFDEHGNGPAREGTPDQPIKVLVFDRDGAPPPPPPPPPGGRQPVVVETEGGGIATKWWFWTIIVGAVVIGAGTAVVFATRGGTVDAVDIDIRGPDPTSAL
jgi:hypothetical protein